MRTYSEKEYKELLGITGFLADVLNEIAYGSVHESDDLSGEWCDCPQDYAIAALKLNYEDFIVWKVQDSMFGWKRGKREEAKGDK